MRIIPVINRIDTEVPALQEVDAARSLDAIEQIADAPAAFVHSFDEDAEANANIGAISQRNTERFAVKIVARNVMSGTEELEDIRDAVKNTLIGWQITNGHDPIEFSNGRLLAIDGDLIWWIDVYRTAIYLRT